MDAQITEDYSYMQRSLDKIAVQYIELKQRPQRRNNGIVKHTVNELIDFMKVLDEDFAKLNPVAQLSGSVYNKLKIQEPTEFDIMVKLTLKSKNIILDSSKSLPEYTNIYKQSLPKISSSDGRLSAKLMREWMQSLCDKVLNSIKNGKPGARIKNLDIKITHTSSGPAYTLVIDSLYLDEPINVDLVPCIVMPKEKQPLNSTVDFSKVKRYTYNLVPKPTQNEFDWRMSFNKQEKEMMYNKYNLRNVIRLMKLLHNNQDGLTGLASYHITTMFLFEIEKSTYWFWQNSTADLLMYMLKVLRNQLATGSMNSYWCPNATVFSKGLDRVTIYQIAGRLDNIIKDIDTNAKSNPRLIVEYFTGYK